MTITKKLLKGLGCVFAIAAVYSPASAAITEETVRSTCIGAIENSCSALPEPEQTFCEGSMENVGAICDIAVDQLGMVLDLARAHGDALTASATKTNTRGQRSVSASLTLAGSLNAPGSPAVAICVGTTSNADDINMDCASGGTVLEVSPTLAIGFDPTVRVPQSSSDKVCAKVSGNWNGVPSTLEPGPAEACIDANDLVMSPGVPIP